MTKPTLVQSLLNRPSQTYVNLNIDTQAKKDYHSARQEMLRIAESAKVPGGGGSGGVEPYVVNVVTCSSAPSMTATKKKELSESRSFSVPQALKNGISQEYDDDDDNDELELYFTPNTSPRTSMASSVTFPTSRGPPRKPSRKSLTKVTTDSYTALQPVDTGIPVKKVPSSSSIAVPSTRTPSSPGTRARLALSTSSSLSSTSLDGHSVFSDYIGSVESTLLTSPYQSDVGDARGQPKSKSKPMRSDTMRSTSTNGRRKNPDDWERDVTWIVAPDASASKGKSSVNTLKATGHPSRTENSSGGSRNNSLARTGSGSKHSYSTAVESRNTDSKPSSKAKTNEYVNDSSEKATLNQMNQAPPTTKPTSSKKWVPPRHHTFSAFAPLSAPSTPATSPQQFENPTAKDISKTSLVLQVQAPPAPSLLSSSTNNDSYIPTHTYSNDLNKSSSSTSSGNKARNANQTTQTTNQTNSQNRRKPQVSKPLPPTMTNMSVLLEEDEDPLTPRTEVNGYVQVTSNQTWDSGQNKRRNIRDANGNGNVNNIVNLNEGQPVVGRPHSLRHTSKQELRHRRSRSLDSSTPSNSNSTHTFRGQPNTVSDEVQAVLSSFGSSGDRPSKGTQGYTSLVVPRAPPPASAALSGAITTNSKGFGIARGDNWLYSNGKIDLTRSGLAQTTMATVEVVRGLGSKGNTGILFGLGGILGFRRRRSNSAGAGGMGRHGSSNTRPSTTDGVGNGNNPRSLFPGGPESTPLRFTSYRSPPTSVPSSSVLVQVWAVAVDGVDGKLVGVNFGRSGYAEDSEPEQDEDTEQEEEGGDVDEDDDDDAAPNEPSNSQEGLPLPPKKSGFAGLGLGRSLSLRLTRAGSIKQKSKPADVKRSASAAVPSTKKGEEATPPKRSLSFSLKRSNTAASKASSVRNNQDASAAGKKKEKKSNKVKSPKVFQAGVGYVPGRSFVGRVLECGWDVRDEVVKKGEWVVGLLDVRKGGALAEFIVVDRHRVHRVPHPREGSESRQDPSSPVWTASPTSSQGVNSPPTLTLEELALLPLCGLPAYRAVRTFIFAFSSVLDGNSTPRTADQRAKFEQGPTSNSSISSTKVPSKVTTDQGLRRRALVLRGHDGVGAMAVQMLVLCGWRVSVHVPYSSLPSFAPQEVIDRFLEVVEERARDWGADEVIFDDGKEGGGVDDGRGAAIRVLDVLRESGDVFDAVLDTVGGKGVRDAAEKLLRSNGPHVSGLSVDESTKGNNHRASRRGAGQFTTLVGDVPERVIPSAGDNFRAGLRSLRIGSNLASPADVAHGGAHGNGRKSHDEIVKGSGKVGYAWVSVGQDVDWEGDDIGETLRSVVSMALQNGVRPLVNEDGLPSGTKEAFGRHRVVPFESSPYLFVDNGPLRDGGTAVVKVA